jgi:hypothetical protein
MVACIGFETNADRWTAYLGCAKLSDYKITAQPNPALIGVDLHLLKIKDDPLGEE